MPNTMLKDKLKLWQHYSFKNQCGHCTCHNYLLGYF